MLEDVIKVATRINRMAEKQGKALGVNTGVAREALGDCVRMVMGHLGEDPAVIQELFNKHLDAEAEAGVPWAVEYRRATLEKNIKPAFDKAQAAGVDPIAVVMADCRLSRETAERMIAALETAEAPNEPPF